MELRVLIDNNTLIDRYYFGEPGVSYYLEVEGIKVLFDLGYSDAFLKNGYKMGVDFTNLDYVVLSHSHLDHTWGMPHLLMAFNETLMEGKKYKRPTLIAHPDVFVPRSFNDTDEFGMITQQSLVSKYMETTLTKKECWLTDKLVFLGEIPRQNDFEAKMPIGQINIDGVTTDDFSIDDSALCYCSEDGLVIVTGCSHAGICNIIEHAKAITGIDKIADVIGGFHLQNPDPKQLEMTVQYFKRLHTESIHACHCTDLASKIELSKAIEVLEVGVGMTLNYK